MYTWHHTGWARRPAGTGSCIQLIWGRGRNSNVALDGEAGDWVECRVVGDVAPAALVAGVVAPKSTQHMRPRHGCGVHV